MGIAWCSSLFMLFLHVYRSRGRAVSMESGNPHDLLIDKVFIAPFALFLASFWLLLVLGLVATVVFSWDKISLPNFVKIELLLIELSVAGACLLWVPFGALISRRLARARELPVRRYAVAGAIYSATFFLPWLYLVIRMRNRTIWNPAIWFVYFVVFAAWLLGPIAVTVEQTDIAVKYSGGFPFRSLLFVGGALAMSIAWCSSLFLLVSNVWRARGRAANLDASKPSDSLIGGVYISPFALFFVSMAFLLSMWFRVP